MEEGWRLVRQQPPGLAGAHEQGIYKQSYADTTTVD